MALADVIKKIFGSKADRDMKAVKPILDKVLAAYPEIDKLSNDGLRAKSEELKKRIREVEAPFETRIAEIKEELAKDIPVSEKEALATESDKLVKDEDEAIEKILNEILPEAFSIMKSTARRFAQNETISVSATDFDRYLAASGKDFVHIDGDKLFKDYINEYMQKAKDDVIHQVAETFGIDELQLRDFKRSKVTEDDIDKLGRFTTLKSTADISKAKAYFDHRDGCDNKLPRVRQKLDVCLRNFIINDVFQ